MDFIYNNDELFDKHIINEISLYLLAKALTPKLRIKLIEKMLDNANCIEIFKNSKSYFLEVFIKELDPSARTYLENRRAKHEKNADSKKTKNYIE